MNVWDARRRILERDVVRREALEAERIVGAADEGQEVEDPAPDVRLAHPQADLFVGTFQSAASGSPRRNGAVGVPPGEHAGNPEGRQAAAIDAGAITRPRAKPWLPTLFSARTMSIEWGV